MQVIADLLTVDMQVQICTGAILNERWVVATAYCAEWNIYNVPMIIRLGAHAREDDGFEIRSKRVISSIETEKGQEPNGVALIELQKSIRFGPLAQPIRVGREFMEEGARGTTVGWGHEFLSENSGISKTYLQYFPVQTMEQEICVNMVRTEFCIVNTLSAEGVVYTDYSAPTVINDTLIGLTDGWARKMTVWPMFRISDYAAWIEETIKL